MSHRLPSVLLLLAFVSVALIPVALGSGAEYDMSERPWVSLCFTRWSSSPRFWLANHPMALQLSQGVLLAEYHQGRLVPTDHQLSAFRLAISAAANVDVLGEASPVAFNSERALFSHGAYERALDDVLARAHLQVRPKASARVLVTSSWDTSVYANTQEVSTSTFSSVLSRPRHGQKQLVPSLFPLLTEAELGGVLDTVSPNVYYTCQQVLLMPLFNLSMHIDAEAAAQQTFNSATPLITSLLHGHRLAVALNMTVPVRSNPTAVAFENDNEDIVVHLREVLAGRLDYAGWDALYSNISFAGHFEWPRTYAESVTLDQQPEMKQLEELTVEGRHVSFAELDIRQLRSISQMLQQMMARVHVNVAQPVAVEVSNVTTTAITPILFKSSKCIRNRLPPLALVIFVANLTFMGVIMSIMLAIVVAYLLTGMTLAYAQRRYNYNLVPSWMSIHDVDTTLHFMYIPWPWPSNDNQPGQPAAAVAAPQPQHAHIE